MWGTSIRRQPPTGEARVVLLTEPNGSPALRVVRTDEQIVMSGRVARRRHSSLTDALRKHDGRCCTFRGSLFPDQGGRYSVEITVRCMLGLQRVLDVLKRPDGVNGEVPKRDRPAKSASAESRPVPRRRRPARDDVNGGGRVAPYGHLKVSRRRPRYDETPRLWGAQAPAPALSFGEIGADDDRFYQKGRVVESK